MKIIPAITVSLCVSLAFYGTALAQEQAAVASNRPISEIRDIFSYFHTPANVVQIQVANDKTLYAWQNMSAFQYTMQIDRDGPITVLPEKIDPKIGKVAFTRPGEKPETVDQHLATSHDYQGTGGPARQHAQARHHRGSENGLRQAERRG